MKKIIFCACIIITAGCVPQNVRLKQTELDFIKKCAYVNIVKDPEISCSYPVTGASMLLGAIGEAPDLERKKEINKIVNNFDVDKVFSFKMYELLEEKNILPLAQRNLVDTALCVKEIKAARKEETFRNYPLEKENLYAPLEKYGIDCVLQTYVLWYGLERPTTTSNTKINLKVNAVLVRIKDNKILWKNMGTDTYDLSEKTFEYEEFLAGGGARLREALVEAVEIAANELLKKLLTTK